MGIIHRKVSGKSDGGDATLVLPSDWNNTHKIDLDGLVCGHRIGATENRWYPAGMDANVVLATLAVVAGRDYAFPFVPTKDMDANTLAVNVTTLVAGTLRMGIYRGDGNLYPSTLVTGTDIGSLTLAAGVLTRTMPADTLLTGGEVYWIVANFSSASTVRSLAVGSMIPILGLDSTLGTAPGVGWIATRAHAALLSTFPAGAAVHTGAAPALFIRGVVA
jgi:hypothetical protein